MLRRLSEMGLVAHERYRGVSLTPEGETLLAQAPLAGPVRLRQIAEDPARLERLAAALEDAVTLFGLGTWAPKGKA